MRTLIVDDSAVICNLIERALALAGLPLTHTTHAANGFEALEHLRASPAPDLILTDLNMPIMNGLDFLERRHAASLAPHAIVLLLGTGNNPAVLHRAVSLGTHACLAKPVHTAQLRRLLVPFFMPSGAPPNPSAWPAGCPWPIPPRFPTETPTALPLYLPLPQPSPRS